MVLAGQAARRLRGHHGCGKVLAEGPFERAPDRSLVHHFEHAGVGSPAVQIELHGENYDRLVVSVADAPASAAALR